jgi:hypothetical protein
MVFGAQEATSELTQTFIAELKKKNLNCFARQAGSFI